MPFLGSCTPLGIAGDGAGLCTTEDGTQVNTYQLVGKWKKITPYDPARSDTELQTNFELLIVENGVVSGTSQTPLCAVEVVNSGISQVNYRGVYSANLTAKTVDIQFTEGTLGTGSATATYSFSGSCSDTRLSLTYDGGSTETYKYYAGASSVQSGDCNPE